MATNSRSCKIWSLTLVSAVLVLIARTDKPEYTLIALVPAVMLWSLDIYYLAQERRFRESYLRFVRKLHQMSLLPIDLFDLGSTDLSRQHLFRSTISFSTCPFYGTLLAMVYILTGSIGN